jgi:hypothetical protein
MIAIRKKNLIMAFVIMIMEMTNVKNMYGLISQSCNHMWPKKYIYSYLCNHNNHVLMYF